jgi:hypothetical protein
MISKERICFYPITSNDGAQKKAHVVEQSKKRLKKLLDYF